MGQNLGAAVGKNGSTLEYINVDASGNIILSPGQSTQPPANLTSNITANTTIGAAGVIINGYAVTAIGTTAGVIYDSIDAGNSTGHQIAPTGNVSTGVTMFGSNGIQLTHGIFVAPGSGQTICIFTLRKDWAGATTQELTDG